MSRLSIIGDPMDPEDFDSKRPAKTSRWAVLVGIFIMGVLVGMAIAIELFESR